MKQPAPQRKTEEITEMNKHDTVIGYRAFAQAVRQAAFAWFG